MTSVEGKQKKKGYECEVCWKAFSKKSDFIKHLRTHTGERPFKCEHCDKSFTQKINLNVHTRLHTGEKPFKCPQCEKPFSQKVHRDAHLRMHTCQKVYNCNHCDASFNRKGKLGEHVRLQHIRKQYICDHENCGESFNKHLDLNIHRLAHAGVYPLKREQSEPSVPGNSKFVAHTDAAQSDSSDEDAEDQNGGTSSVDHSKAPIRRRKGKLGGYTKSQLKFKAYRCEHQSCGMAFSKHLDLTIHRLTHTTEAEPMKREQCEASVPSNSKFVAHTEAAAESDSSDEYEDDDDYGDGVMTSFADTKSGALVGHFLDSYGQPLIKKEIKQEAEKVGDRHHIKVELSQDKT